MSEFCCRSALTFKRLLLLTISSHLFRTHSQTLHIPFCKLSVHLFREIVVYKLVTFLLGSFRFLALFSVAELTLISFRKLSVHLFPFRKHTFPSANTHAAFPSVNTHSLPQTRIPFRKHAFPSANTYPLPETRIPFRKPAFLSANTHSLSQTRITFRKHAFPSANTHSLPQTRIPFRKHAFPSANTHSLPQPPEPESELNHRI